MRILITGTGPGVGKTWVACALARTLREARKQVVAIKPVETGCSRQPSAREDGALLARATGQTQPSHALVRLPDTGSPVLANDGSGTPIDFDSLILKIERCTEGPEFLLVEGLGGLLTPVTWEWNMADVARALGAAALVVGVDRLGTINATLLTLSALELAGIACAGVVLTTPEHKDQSSGGNGPAIARLSGLERVTTLDRTMEPKQAAAAMTEVVSWFGRVGAAA